MDKQEEQIKCKHLWIGDGLGNFRWCELCGLQQRTVTVREWENLGYIKVKPSEVK
jgi:hypothetical protein